MVPLPRTTSPFVEDGGLARAAALRFEGDRQLVGADLLASRTGRWR